MTELAPDRASVEALIDRLFGELSDPPSVDTGPWLHVVACVERAGWLYPMQIGPGSPSSDHDRFILELARARSDAIVTTGAILRAEPSLRYALPPGLRAWRGDRPLRPAVLTSGRDLPRGHPLWGEEESEPFLITDADGAARIGDGPAPVVALEAGFTLVDALAELPGLVVIEAGPRTASELYAGDGPHALWLSVFEGTVGDDRLAGPLVSLERLARMERVSSATVEEASGPWRFERYHRA